MFGVGADDSQCPLSLDDSAIPAYLFHRRSNFHSLCPLFESIGDSSLGQIVRRQLEQNPISRKNSYEMLPHSARNMGQYPVFISQFHPKHCIGQCLDNHSLCLDDIALRHTESPLLGLDSDLLPESLKSGARSPSQPPYVHNGPINSCLWLRLSNYPRESRYASPR